MPKLNKLPFFKKHSGNLFHREKFLKGKWKTYFAPGQIRDDTWANFEYDSGQRYIGYTLSPTWKYSNPTDWRSGTSVFSPPQVVNININIEDAYNDVARDPYTGEWSFIYQACTDEQKRLVEIAKNVKKKIEKIRKGKTWVSVNNYYEGSIDNGGGLPLVDDWENFDTHNDLEFNYNLEFVLDLANSFDDFLGTDTLSIYLGDSTFLPQHYGFDVVAATWDESALWKATKDILKKTYKSFFRYSVKLFPCDLSVPLYTSYQDQLLLMWQRAYQTSLTLPVFPCYTSTFEPEGDHFSVEYREFDDPSLNYWWVCEWDPLEGAHPVPIVVPTSYLPITPSKTVFDGIALWGEKNKMDIKSYNNTSDVSSADYLIDLIANHYGFKVAKEN